MPKSHIARWVSRAAAAKKEADKPKEPTTPPPRPEGINRIKQFNQDMGNIAKNPVKQTLSQQQARAYDAARANLVIDDSVSPADLPKMSRQVARVQTGESPDLGDYWKGPEQQKETGRTIDYSKFNTNKPKSEEGAPVLDYGKMNKPKLKMSQSKMVKSFLSVRDKLKKKTDEPLDSKAQKISGYHNCRTFAQALTGINDIEKQPTVKTPQKGDIFWWGHPKGYRHVAVYAGDNHVWQVPEWGAKPEKKSLDEVKSYWEEPTRIHKGGLGPQEQMDKAIRAPDKKETDPKKRSQQYKDYVSSIPKTLYHSGTVFTMNQAKKNNGWISPSRGPVIAQTYEDPDLPKPSKGVFMSDEDKDHGFYSLWQIKNKLGRDPTKEEFLSNAAIAHIDPSRHSDIIHRPHDEVDGQNFIKPWANEPEDKRVTWTSPAQGKELKYMHVEPGDYFSREGVKPHKWLHGEELHQDILKNPHKYHEDVVKLVVGDKVQKSDQVPGGLADKKKPEDFDPRQLEMGVKVEMEHTKDPDLAREIAMDHLAENPKYYSYLDQMEQVMSQGGRVKEILAKLCKMRKSDLHTSDQMKRMAEDNKAFGFVDIHPQDFLNLTTQDKSEMDRIMSDAKDLDFYNEKTQSGNIIQPPHLEFDHATGKIEGHEGRHRAAALLRAGKDKMTVAMYPTRGGYKRRGWNHNEMPSQLVGQFSDHTISFNPQSIKPLNKSKPMEPRVGVGISAVKRRPENPNLSKGLAGDWEKEGYTLKVNNKDPEAITITAHHPKDSSVVGRYHFAVTPWDLEVSDSTTWPDHQRKGLASAAYALAEKHTGKKIDKNPEGLMSMEAKGLWSQKNRKFGKTLSKGLNGDWEKEGYQMEIHKDDPKSDDFTVYAFHPNHGDVGYANFKIKDGVLTPDDNDGRWSAVSVDRGHKRKGIASAMYEAAERHAGKKVVHSDLLSAEGKKFVSGRKVKKAWKPFMD